MSRTLTALVVTCSAACRIGFTEQPLGTVADAPPADLSSDARIVTRTYGERTGSMTTGVTTDATLVEPSPGQNNGLTEHLSIAGGVDIREHGLLRFDLSSIAPGTAVAAAHLDLDIVDYGDAIAGDMAVRTVGQSWAEGDASWIVRATATPWTAAGGTVSAIVATIPQPQPAAATLSIAIPANILAGWIDAPATNFGFAITAADESLDTHYHVHTSESVTETARPLLVLDLAQ